MTTDETALRATIAANPLFTDARLLLADELFEQGRAREAALQRVLAEPQSNARRLEFADVCESEGDVDRAEFVRVQVEVAGIRHDGTEGDDGCPTCEQLKTLRVRERQLLTVANSLTWAWRPIVDRSAASLHRAAFAPWRFRRGFIESITCDSADWLRDGDATCERHPVTAVTLTTMPQVEYIQLLDRSDRHRCSYEIGGRVVTINLDDIRPRGIFSIGSPEHDLLILTVRWPRIAFTLPPAFATADWGTAPANATPIADLRAMIAANDAAFEAFRDAQRAAICEAIGLPPPVPGG